MLPLTLYTTSGCHLCEHAEAILEQGGHRFQAVDIADDLSLMEQYGVRIPVVKDASGEIVELRCSLASKDARRFADLQV